MEHFDVFLSYNGQDREVVARLADKLKQCNVKPWLDAWQLVPGERFQPGLAAGLQASSTCALLIGPGHLGDWQTEEHDVAMNRAAKDRSFRVIPVLLPGLPERFEYDTLPPFLAQRTWVDLRGGIDDAAQLHRLVRGILDEEPGQERAFQRADDDARPYRGLDVFEAEHGKYFFGRAAEVQRLVEKLKAASFLAVLGPSGSGKSSLVRAGLVPALGDGALPGSRGWMFRVLRASATPLAQLAGELSRAANRGTVTAYEEAMRARDSALYQECLGLLAHDAQKLVLVVDQFEEVFTLCDDEVARQRFIANLLYPAAVRASRVVVVLTMRADFYFKCAAHADLATRMAANQFLVSPMSPEGLQQAIEQPAAQEGYALEEGLVAEMLEDIAKQPGALPLLQFALSQLWEHRDRNNGRLTFAAYQKMGGVAGALTKHAEAKYDLLSPAQQKIARRVLLRLTQPGEGTEDTRRTARFDELVTSADDAAEVEETVRQLVDARLLTMAGDTP